MRRSVLAVIGATLLVPLMTATALGAKPTIISFEDDDAIDSALFSDACGFAISAETSGHVILHNAKRGAANEIANWNINTWLTSADGSYHLVDAGPDMILSRAGSEYFTVTGRSVTFSTVIGRVEVDLETGDVVHHGTLVGDEVFDPEWFAPVCAALS